MENSGGPVRPVNHDDARNHDKTEQPAQPAAHPAPESPQAQPNGTAGPQVQPNGTAAQPTPTAGPEAQPSTTAPEPAATAPQVTPSQLPTTLGQSLILNPVAPGPNYYPGVVQRGNSCKGASMITLTGFSGGFEQYTVKSNYRDPQNPTLKAPEVSFKMPARKWAKSGPASQTAPPTASNSKPKAEANDAGKKGTPKEKAPSETATKLPSARPNSQADSQTEMSQDLGYDTEEDEPARGRSPVRQEDAAVTAAASTSTASTTANVPAPRADSCDPEAP